MQNFVGKIPYYFANQPKKAIWLTSYQAEMVDKRRMLDTGLHPDIYMSLIDKKFPIVLVD